MSNMSSDNKIQNKYYGFFIGLYNRNKNILTIAVLIYFASLFLGFIMGYFSMACTCHIHWWIYYYNSNRRLSF